MDGYALIDAGPLTAFYNSKDPYHQDIVDFFQDCTLNLLTTESCITETMHLIGKQKGQSYKVQAQLSQDIDDGIWTIEALTREDFSTITQLFKRYSNVPADFADLTLVAISKRLTIPEIVTLDSDFDIYRRLTTPPSPFVRIFYPKPKFSKDN